MGREELGQADEQEQGEHDVRDDEGELERHEANRPALLTQTAEHYSLEGVLRDDEGHAGDVFGVRSVAEAAGDGMQEAQNRRQEHQRHQPHHAKRGAVHHAAVFLLLAAEAEEGGLHAESEQGEQQRRVGVEVGDDAVAAALGSYVICVDGDEQVVEKTPDY